MLIAGTVTRCSSCRFRSRFISHGGFANAVIAQFDLPPTTVLHRCHHDLLHRRNVPHTPAVHRRFDGFQPRILHLCRHIPLRRVPAGGEDRHDHVGRLVHLRDLSRLARSRALVPSGRPTAKISRPTPNNDAPRRTRRRCVSVSVLPSRYTVALIPGMQCTQELFVEIAARLRGRLAAGVRVELRQSCRRRCCAQSLTCSTRARRICHSGRALASAAPLPWRPHALPRGGFRQW